jgi:hypothetical protein
MMTEIEWTVLGEYVRWVANEIGLRDWHLLLSQIPPDEGCYAMIYPTEGRKHARLQVCADFRSLSLDVQRQAIVHELIHCHLAPATDFIRLDLNNTGMLTQPVYDMLWASYKRQIECATDGMADEWAKHLPLIEWPAATLPDQVHPAEET